MKRNLGIDLFRLFLSFLVITPHCQPLFGEDSLVGWFISNGIARIAVPIFFLISGYYIVDKISDANKVKKYLLHILIVYLVWSLIYLPIYIDEIASRSLITFALMGYYHLWFLPALITGILILYFLLKFCKNSNVLLFVAAWFFIGGYLLERFGFGYRVFTNGIFFGFPFVTFGYYIGKKSIGNRMKNPLVIFIAIVSMGSLLFESYIGYLKHEYYNFYLSLFILSPCLFCVVMRNFSRTSNSNFLGKLSAGVYYSHVLVISLFARLASENNIYNYPIIIIFSLIVATFVHILNKKIKILL